jgi:Domain of unknown function (DUF927)
MSISKTRRIHDLSTDSYLDEIQFEDTVRMTKTIRLPPSVVQDARLFRKQLLDAGADLPSDWQETRQLLEDVAASRVDAHCILARQPGWLEDGQAYVRADKVIGVAANLIGFRRSIPNDPRGNVIRRGDTNSWKRDVAVPAKSSSVLMLGISAALASPLLKVVGHESFGFCISAPSRYGKTLATLAAGSVVGLGGHQQLLTWNQTDARLQEQLPEINDCLTPIDDLKSMTGSDRHKYTRVGSLAYILATGAGTGRHSTFGQRKEELWKTILFTSNEYSIGELARRCGLERDAGETVRLIDVPVRFDDASTIFDREQTELGWADWFRACEENQGHVFEAFVEKLIMRPNIDARVQRYVERFVTRVRQTDDGNLAFDVARKFGLVFAAGRLAIRFRLLPWSRDELFDALTRCYRAARDLLPDSGVLLRSGRTALRRFARSLPNLSDVSERSCRALDGFSEQRGERVRCLIKREKFNAVFSTLDQRNLVLDSLLAQGRITLANVSTGRPRIKEQHIWPDGDRYRSVEIFWVVSK